MMDRGCAMTVKRQAEVLALSRSSIYYEPRPLPERDLVLMRWMDELHLKWPFYGARKLRHELMFDGHAIGLRHVRTLMRRMGMETIYRKPRTSIPAREAAIRPYLLTGLTISRPNQVWVVDLTYIPMAHGFQYLVAILDVWSRKVLSWRVSNTMDAGLLRRGPAGGSGSPWQAGDFQHRPGLAVYVRGLDWRSGRG